MPQFQTQLKDVEESADNALTSFKKRRILPGSSLFRYLPPSFRANCLDVVDSTSRKKSENISWAGIPETALRVICSKLSASGNHWESIKSLYAASEVCKSWRMVALPLILQELWGKPAHSDFHQAAQLFSLDPDEDERLTKCSIIREETTGSSGDMLVHFSLFLESEDPRTEPKFLLCARQHNRQRISIYLDPLGRGIPCAKLFSNVLGTTHKLVKCPDSLFPAAVMKPHLNSIIPINDVLTSIQYKLRMKGMMQPRKLNVVLPKPYENLEAQNQTRSEIRIKRNGTHSTKSLMDAINRRQSEPSFKAKSFLQRASANRLSPIPTMKLVNKQPHWNEALKCWCLNFRGRVKLASVKNFQLTCPSEQNGKIIMQFGKADVNSFILDFNPAKISVVQAFAIALTSFEGRVLF